MYIFLFFSCAVLALGPILCQLINEESEAMYFIDSFVFCSIFGLLLFHILPESIKQGGFVILLFVSLGFAFPFVFDYFSSSNKCSREPLVYIASIGFFIHSILDGVTLCILNNSSCGHVFSFGAALVFHRLPEGIGVWRLFKATIGPRMSSFIVAGMAFFTCIGFIFGEGLIHSVSKITLLNLQSLTAGMLLHILCHRNCLNALVENLLNRRRMHFGARVGLICGFVFVLGLYSLESTHVH